MIKKVWRKFSSYLLKQVTYYDAAFAPTKSLASLPTCFTPVLALNEGLKSCSFLMLL